DCTSKRRSTRMCLTLMAVVVMVLFRLNDWNHAAVGDFANCMLKLDGSVINAEVVMQTVLHVAQDPLADRRRNVGDRNMAGESMGFRSNTPDVQIVNIVDAAD